MYAAISLLNRPSLIYIFIAKSVLSIRSQSTIFPPPENIKGYRKGALGTNRLMGVYISNYLE